MVTAEKVIEIYNKLMASEIQIWLTGGWGIDALLGEQTRDHKDLDVIMLRDDVVRMREIMEKEGYELKELWSENQSIKDSKGNKIATAFVLMDEEKREFDAHAMVIDEKGNGIPAWDVEEGFTFNKEELEGEGEILGLAVKCITPESQMKCHASYDLPENQKRDLQLLHQKYGSE